MLLSIALSCKKDSNKLNIYTNATAPDSIALNNYDKGLYFAKLHKQDSAYTYFQKALLGFEKNKDNYNLSLVYIELTLLDYQNNNLISSQANGIKALTYLPDNKKYKKYKGKIINAIGLSSERLKQYKNAITYYEKYKNMYADITLYPKKNITYLNNMGMLFQEKKEYKKSISFFTKIINTDSIATKFPIKYARALDNKAWSLFLNNNQDAAYPIFLKSLKIRESQKDKPGMIMSYLHLANYHIYNKQNKNAYNFALKSYKLCTEIFDTNSELEALYLLAKTDDENAVIYFNKYKERQKILLQQERNYKDQTAKIRYETEQNKKKIAKQHAQIEKKDKALLWGTIVAGLIGLSALLFLFQKIKISKQKEELTTQKEALETQNEQIKILKKEVHHKVNNDLLMALNFLDEAKKQPSKTALENLEFRIKSMLYLHQQLYISDTKGRVNMQEYIDTICENIHIAYHNANKQINYSLDAAVNITSKKARLIGIISNELITNIYKYAFENRATGNYHFSLKREQEKIILLVVDNGVGFPKDFDNDTSTSFGWKMIKGLVKQLDSKNGKVTSQSDQKGSRVTIIFDDKISV